MWQARPRSACAALRWLELGQDTLIVFAGLPGAGKTTIARALARELQAACSRIDTIEMAG